MRTLPPYFGDLGDDRQSVRVTTQHGFTLIETVVVILVIGILTSVALVRGDLSGTQARHRATQREMEALTRAIVGDPALYSSSSRGSFGYVGDIGAFPVTLDDLLVSPVGWTTWRGPYMSSGTGAIDATRDEWGVAYVYSGVALQSTGSGSAITKALGGVTADFTANSIRGVVTDVSGRPPGAAAASVTVTFIYPNGAGGAVSVSVSPTANGAFSFANAPIGAHELRVVSSVSADTIRQTITVTPRSVASVRARFGVSLW